MKRSLLFILSGLSVFFTEHLFSQCITAASAVADVTLQCTSTFGQANRTAVAFNPLLNLYYSVDAGSASYPLETFAVTGGAALATTNQGADFRGYWWNPVAGVPEGNTFSNGGVYSNSLTPGGYALNTTSLMSSATMPNAQSAGAADFAGNRIIYYNSGTIYLYSKSSNTLISSTSITGLPAASTNLNSYAVGFTGVPGSELALYNYSSKAVYFVNINTTAYTSSCSLPASAPAASAFQMGYANNRIFLFEAGTFRWYGYPVVISPSVAATSTAICSGSSSTLNVSGASSYSWSNGASTPSIAVSPTSTTVYTVQSTYINGCISTSQLTLTVNGAVPALSVTSSTPQTCTGHTVTLTASGALSYTWSTGAANGGTFVASTPGTNNYTVSGQNGCGISTTVTSISVSPLAVSASSSPTLVCAGSTSTLSAVSTGTTYTWTSSSSLSGSAIVSPTVSTIYTVTASDGVCVGNTTVAVVTKPVPVLTIAASNTSICTGNTVNLTVSGNAVTYTWSPGAQTGTSISATPNNLTLYSVTGTNSVNCVSSAQQVILVNPLPVVSASASDLLVCSGGSSTLSASGANTYAWTGGTTGSTLAVNPVATTVYTVTGTSSVNCSAIATISVGVFTPTISVSGNKVICLNNNVTIGADPADSYTWSNGSGNQNIIVSPSLTTVYTVTASVNNSNGLSCPATNTIQVSVNPNPVITASADHSIICIGTSAVLTAGGAGTAGTYTWTGGSGAAQAASISVSPITEQTYTVTGADANGCTGKTTYNLKVSVCAGIAANALDKEHFSIYPNPNNGEFTIQASEELHVTIINNIGQIVHSAGLVPENNYRLHASGLLSGVYVVVLKGNRTTAVEKIIIQN